jgi:uncharacterized membrane protein
MVQAAHTPVGEAMAHVAADRRSLFLAGFALGVGLGGFFDGIVLHQVLQWHHMASSGGHPPSSVDALKFNTLLDGLFHAVTYAFVLVGVVLLWRAGANGMLRGTGRQLIGAVLVGFGAFNLLEGLVNHQLFGLHHVNETVPPDQWWMWDTGFLIWGAAMALAGIALWRRGADTV